jgi:hypothetical protein
MPASALARRSDRPRAYPREPAARQSSSQPPGLVVVIVVFGMGLLAHVAFAIFLDEFNRRKDFKAYHFEQARAFQAHLATSTNACRNRSTFIFCSVATQTQNRKALGERLPVRSRFSPEKSQCCPALSASSASSLITRKNSLDWPMKSPSAVKPWMVATAPPC